jgi:hypothetical protein
MPKIVVVEENAGNNVVFKNNASLNKICFTLFSSLRPKTEGYASNK